MLLVITRQYVKKFVLIQPNVIWKHRAVALNMLQYSHSSEEEVYVLDFNRGNPKNDLLIPKGETHDHGYNQTVFSSCRLALYPPYSLCSLSIFIRENMEYIENIGFNLG